jgi:hypothetical protein
MPHWHIWKSGTTRDKSQGDYRGIKAELRDSIDLFRSRLPVVSASAFSTYWWPLCKPRSSIDLNFEIGGTGPVLGAQLLVNDSWKFIDVWLNMVSMLFHLLLFYSPYKTIFKCFEKHRKDFRWLYSKSVLTSGNNGLWFMAHSLTPVLWCTNGDNFWNVLAIFGCFTSRRSILNSI